MKFLLLALVICAATCVFADGDDDEAWLEFKLEHGKLFLSKGKEAGRKKTFLKNRATVQELEAKAEAGEIQFTPKLYEHADLTTEEFLSRYGGYKHDESAAPLERTYVATVRQNLPVSYDSRAYNYVSEVRKQCSCGSCWAFSAMATIEGNLAVRGFGSFDLSEQQLVDCGYPGQDGCDGGRVEQAFEHLADNGGAVTEAEYPYMGKYQGCRLEDPWGYPIAGPVFPYASKDNIKATIMQQGVLSIAVDCSQWQFYGNGIFHGDIGYGANHAVNVVGWGVENGQEYWIIRNSWGTAFGEKGYIRVSTSEDGGYDLGFTWGVELGL